MTDRQSYLLDTNVISETRRIRPDQRVTSFLLSKGSDRLFMSVLTLGELRKGVVGKRITDPALADRLGLWVDGIEVMFARQILHVDEAVARCWGELSAGRTLPVVDTLIAATAMTHDLTLTTRNGRDVEATGVRLFNPWEYEEEA